LEADNLKGIVLALANVLLAISQSGRVHEKERVHDEGVRSNLLPGPTS
jgi:hypothetical protein